MLGRGWVDPPHGRMVEGGVMVKKQLLQKGLKCFKMNLLSMVFLCQQPPGLVRVGMGWYGLVWVGMGWYRHLTITITIILTTILITVLTTIFTINLTINLTFNLTMFV